jgi:quercetin dioxygenase-like cupin family protein
MARQGQQIHNPRTGQRMTFVELTDDVLRIDTVNPPTTTHEPLHVHPKQESGTELLSGSLVFEIGGERRRLAAGESVSIPPGTPHRFYNDGDTDAHHVQFFRPALDIASLFETAFALEQQGKVGADGMPAPLQLALMVPEFGDELRPVSPPRPVLRALSAILSPIARRRGHRARLTLP